MGSVPSSRSRRLQREPDFTGDRLTRFRDVFLRHGLPGLILALLFLSIPQLQHSLAQSLEKGSASPGLYAFTGVLIVFALSGFSWLADRTWTASKPGWVAYLGALSFWEEWVFRLALPQLMERLGASVALATILSAIVFGGAHYFTLRWRWQWCVGAALGGLFLSRQMNMHGDLLLITAFHWIATLLNTPRPPGPPDGQNARKPPPSDLR